MSEFCKACGKPPVATRAGSVTSYFFQHNYCQCQRRRAGFGTIPSTNLAGSDAAGVCSNCGKSRPSKRRAGSFTAFLFKDLRCVCAGPSEMSQLARNKAPQVDRLNSIHGRSSTAVRVVKRKQFTESLRQAVESQTGSVSIFPPGTVIGGAFKIITMIGQGGMGVVYLAEHTALSRQVALKTLAPELVNEQSWLRFKEEAKTLAALNHKSLVNVYDLGIHDKTIPYYSMDFLDGESLEELLLSAVELPLSKALPIFVEMLDGLAYAHRNGIVHRDIKPGNIMVCTVNGVRVVKILDFGISKLVGPNAVRSQGLTAAGEIFGSAFYMSPEQCSGGRVDARSDLYSVGCTLFEVLTGFVPFEGSGFIETAMMHQEEEIPRLSQLRPDLLLPKSIDLVLAKCMAKSPEDRYQSAKELALDLTRVLEGKEVFITEKVWLPESSRGPNSTTNSQSTPLPVLPILAALGLVASIAMVSILLILKPIDRVVPRSHVASTPVASTPVASTPAEDSFAGLIREQLLSQSVLDRIGASPKEKEFFSTFDWSSETSYEQRYQKIADAYMKATATTEAAPIKFKGIGVFKFPSDFYLGAIQFDNGPINYATGLMPVSYPPARGNDHEVHYYSSVLTRLYPQILDRFGPDDLTGVDISFADPSAALSRLRRWRRLTELSFFNSLGKAIPSYESKIEDTRLNDAMLPSLNSFSNLRSLGLAGDEISGPAVARMPLLKTLKTLKIKRIKNVQPLLEALPRFDNIEELWLMSLGLKDSDLEPLTRMKNLKSLRITRSQLTPASFEYFKRMPALTKLKLDRTWSKEDTERFKQAFPGYEFEPVFDFHFWKLAPGKAPSEQ